MSKHIVERTFILTSEAKRLLEATRKKFGLSSQMVRLFHMNRVTMVSYCDDEDEGDELYGVRIKFKEIGLHPASNEGYKYKYSFLQELLKQENRIMEVE